MGAVPHPWWEAKKGCPQGTGLFRGEAGRHPARARTYTWAWLTRNRAGSTLSPTGVGV